MTDITGISNSSAAFDAKNYSAISQENTTNPAKKEDVKEQSVNNAEARNERVIEMDPKDRAIYDRVMGNYSNKTAEERLTVQDIIRSFINLTQILQQGIIIESERLSISTQLLNAYAKKMSQVPVILKDEIKEPGWDDKDQREGFNQKFGYALETMRAHKGLEEDRAKKGQTLLQAMKDASSSYSDFSSSFIDLVRGISQKITSS